VFCLGVKYKIQSQFHEILVITMYDHGYITSHLDLIQQFPQPKGFLHATLYKTIYLTFVEDFALHLYFLSPYMCPFFKNKDVTHHGF